MKLPFFSFLSLVMIAVTLPAEAQSGYSISEVIPGEVAKRIYAQDSNSAGWLATTATNASSTQYEIFGPSGYRRDITPFLEIQESSDFASYASIMAITFDGAVIYARNRVPKPFVSKPGTEEGRETSLLRLGRDATAPTEIATFPGGEEIENFLANARGEILVVSQSVAAPKESVVVTTIVSGATQKRTITLPDTARARRSFATSQLDDAGNFVIYDTFNPRKGRPRVTNFCRGTVSSDTVSCADRSGLAIFPRKNFVGSQLENGLLLTQSFRDYRIIDINTLQYTARYKLPQGRILSSAGIALNGSLLVTSVKTFQTSKTLELVVAESDGKTTKFACDAIRKLRLPWLNALTTNIGINGAIVVSQTRPRSDKPVPVFLLTPVSGNEAPGPEQVGTCTQIK